MYMCMWDCLDKYIGVATWPPKQKFMALLQRARDVNSSQHFIGFFLLE